jgi:alkylhydroperoxidase/carboxymuconolactone decarboxylase family protein YurZ
LLLLAPNSQCLRLHVYKCSSNGDKKQSGFEGLPFGLFDNTFERKTIGCILYVIIFVSGNPAACSMLRAPKARSAHSRNLQQKQQNTAPHGHVT